MIKVSCRCEEVGSTALMGFSRIEEGRRVLYVSNIGDTKAVIFQDSSYKCLTYDHRGTDSLEGERVRREGGTIFNGRVNGFLAVTRAFGDQFLKKNGVSVIPHVEKVEIRLIDKYLVAGSDGLWDTLAEEDVIEFIRKSSTAEELSKMLLKQTLANGSRDNTSVLAIRLKA
eukprot:TRINITY_DN2394_c0_g3_i1.p1 TRINITY_DN2394_c0_g3~~TRINITY_DN2394_c0_g3_i1.p1  ORF type:complete len:171 (+),score=24.53 TRINITY_DN2394_c0_g3_i1:384-896(+)